jgi:DNA-binding NarL/FixJ family response regulator
LSPKIRIFLCDDVPELRTLLRYALEEDRRFEIAGEAGTAAQGIAEVRRLQPDVVLLDLSMPGMDGLEAIPHMREAAPRAAIIVFSGFAAERLRDTALALGAVGYI